jgi:hypothetical protein
MSRLLKEVPMRRGFETQSNQPQQNDRNYNQGFSIQDAVEETRKRQEQQMMKEMMREMGGSVSSQNLNQFGGFYQQQQKPAQPQSQLLREVPRMDASMYADPINKLPQVLGEVMGQKTTPTKTKLTEEDLFAKENVEQWKLITERILNKSFANSFQKSYLDIFVNNPYDYALQNKFESNYDQSYLKNPVEDEHLIVLQFRNEKNTTYSTKQVNMGGMLLEVDYRQS